jgi:ABC-type Fe3+/spermidine/putrescine transport system ATPase subunit
MNRGHIEQFGTPREIYDRPASDFVAGFIGETNFIRLGDSRVAVRPESMRIVAGRTEGASRLEGEVLATMVVGPAVQVVVRSDDGQELIVRWQRTGGEEEVHAPKEGERVGVGWSDDSTLDLGAEKEVSHV